MQLRGILLASALLGAPFAAEAQPFQGLYIGAGAGLGLTQSTGATTYTPLGATSTTIHEGAGVTGLGSVGYGFGNGLRLEIEGDYRHNNISNITGSPFPASSSGSVNRYGVMANALFDLDIGVRWLFPYIGAGAGYQWTNFNNVSVTGTTVPFSSVVNNTAGTFAWQAIAGLSFPIPNVPGLSITTEYRFLDVLSGEKFGGTLISPLATLPTTTKLNAQYNHSIMLGVRYAFNVAPPPVAAPAAAVAPAPAPARSYLVFFDWDKATLTDRARQIIKEAADNSTRVQYTRIEVNGYTDTSGSPKYNQGLSVRRAQAVASELVKDGVPKAAISIQGFGDTHLLVPTGPGVREPQNRRVEIIIR